MLFAKYKNRRYSLSSLLCAYASRLHILLTKGSFDLLWIEKEALPWWPRWVESALLAGVPYVLDYDDAVFHNYDRHWLAAVRFTYGRRLDGLMARAALVVGGNDYLVQRARDAEAPWAEVLPTVIDLDRYPAPAVESVRAAERLARIVWIGSPSTVHYLRLLQEPLQRLAQRVPFVLRVIGGDFALPGVQVECLPWSGDTEVAYITAADVGVMPLLDSPWERGKCGYKLIQYMACGLPVVASDVGVNPEIVRHKENGYLASTPDDWVAALEALLQSPSLRAQLGAQGRRRVEEAYCIQKTGPLMAQLLRTAAGKI